MGGEFVGRPSKYEQEIDLISLELGGLTLATYLEKGSPPSRANAHNIREAVATVPMVANI